MEQAGFAGLAARGLAGRFPRQRAVDLVNIEVSRIEITADPLPKLPVAPVLAVRHRLDEIRVPPRASDVLGRTAPGPLDQTGMEDGRVDRLDRFQHHHAAPVVAIVVNILEVANAMGSER